MKRIKIAIWGGSYKVYDSIRENINPMVSRIIAITDSDKHKQGLCFNGIPIISIEELIAEEVDYILIAAYSGMQIIIDGLSKIVEHRKIQPYISPTLCEYNVGDISGLEWEKSLCLYFRPNDTKDTIMEYITLYEQYKRIVPFQITGSEWFYEKRLISHAGGGFVNGWPFEYTNSREALSYSIKNGFRLVECDVMRMPNNEWVLGHNYHNYYDSERYSFSILSLRDFLVLLESEKQITCLIDVKRWTKTKEYEEFVEVLKYELNRFVNHKEIWSRIVLEVYDEETITMAKGFQMIFTQYRNPEVKKYIKTAVLCAKYNIPAVILETYTITDHGIQDIIDKGIVYYATFADYPEDYSRVREKGGYGVLTNYLTEI